MRLRSAFVALSLVVLGCKEEPPPPPPPPRPVEKPVEKPKTVDIPADKLAAFAPLPADMASAENPSTDEKVALGRMLYFDKRLSKNHDVACNSCHVLDKYGVDNQPTSTGHKGQKGGRNSPTVYNAALHLAQFWDGRAATVEDQAKGPVLNPVEMAMPDAKAVEKVLSSMPEYVDAFKKAFPGDKKPVSFDNMAKAIAAFERKLVTPSKWDTFLGGDKAALTDAEKEGFLKFVETGCTACHNGATVGGQAYMKLGLVTPWPGDKDLGRFDVTKNEADKFVFKVPSLRNIEKTAPYFHDGSVATLPEAVKLMAKHQLGKDLSDADTSSIVAFLGTLTGELPADLIAEPTLPKSTAKTPKPNPN
ncbi:MAG: cytochrome-c peroxidase [Myxococcota bacterium]